MYNFLSGNSSDKNIFPGTSGNLFSLMTASTWGEKRDVFAMSCTLSSLRYISLGTFLTYGIDH